MSPESSSSYSYTFRVALDRRTVFQLLAEPRILDRLTPPWFRLRPRTEIPAELEVGTEISYRLRWRGLPFQWTSRITDWVPDEFFAYEQKRGPYRFFRHEHSFTAGKGFTEIRDDVFFRAPGGRLADSLIARPDLRRIFAFRERHLAAVLEELQADTAAGRLASRIP